MKIAELQHQIVSKRLDKCYLFYGEEVGVMDIYLRKIYATLGADVVTCDTVQEAFSRMTQRRISGGARCFVVRDDKEFFKQENIWEKVFAESEKCSDYLVIIYSSMDKRSKFYKQYIDRLTEFELLSPDMLVKYIDKELPQFGAKNAESLAQMCEFNYNRVLLECDKIRQYARFLNDGCAAPSYDFGQCFEVLVKEGIIHQPIGDITFKLTDAILTRNLRETGRYLRQARLKQEPEIMVLSILYNGFKHILMVQGLGADQSEPCKRTGLTPWEVKMSKEKQGHYTISELQKALAVVRKAEKGIKTGQMEAEASLEYVVINIM